MFPRRWKKKKPDPVFTEGRPVCILHHHSPHDHGGGAGTGQIQEILRVVLLKAMLQFLDASQRTVHPFPKLELQSISAVVLASVVRGHESNNLRHHKAVEGEVCKVNLSLVGGINMRGGDSGGRGGGDQFGFQEDAIWYEGTGQLCRSSPRAPSYPAHASTRHHQGSPGGLDRCVGPPHRRAAHRQAAKLLHGRHHLHDLRTIFPNQQR